MLLDVAEDDEDDDEDEDEDEDDDEDEELFSELAPPSPGIAQLAARAIDILPSNAIQRIANFLMCFINNS